MTVETILSEPLRNFDVVQGSEQREKIQHLLMTVGMDPRCMRRYPHEFSGGQRQRIGIARALALGPDFIVADEPISALDVSIQAQIMNLLSELRENLGLTLLFIAHDLAAIRHVSDRIAVMYLGRIVELADAQTIVDRPQHPLHTGTVICRTNTGPYPRTITPTYSVVRGDAESDQPAVRMSISYSLSTI